MSNLTVSVINSVDVQNLASKIARAWVNFNGTGVVAIRSSYNVASITDNGVGSYDVNFSTPMANGNYATLVTGEHVGGSANRTSGASSAYFAPTVSAVRVATYTATPSGADAESVNVLVFG